MTFKKALFYCNLLFALYCISCGVEQKRNATMIADYQPFEFVDSTSMDSNIAILLTAMNDSADSYIRLRLLAYEDSIGWGLRQTFDSIFPTINGLVEANFIDFNSDNISDVLVSLGTGARGGSEFFQLFLYDAKARHLRKIHGFNEIPNPEPDSVSMGIYGMRLVGADSVYYETYQVNGDSVFLKNVDRHSLVTDSE